MTADDFILVRSDAGDGGWSLHAAGSTDEDIAAGEAPAIASGPSEADADGGWTRPNRADFARAAAAVREG